MTKILANAKVQIGSQFGEYLLSIDIIDPMSANSKTGEVKIKFDYDPITTYCSIKCTKEFLEDFTDFINQSARDVGVSLDDLKKTNHRLNRRLRRG